MAQETDVLICGSGSAGLCAAAWLARCGIRCRILDQRSGPLVNGQADGVQCRTIEVYESFGLSEDLLREAYHVLEVAFWSRNAEGCLERNSRTADTAPGLSHQPHVILNQARVHELLLEAMRKWNGQHVDYGYKVKGVEVDSAAAADPKARCLTVVTEKDGKEETFKAKYVLGCDGAHSTIRKSLGYKMIGDTSDAVWGVMDVYPQTNFPDIRKKATLRTNSGNILIIPREGGSLCRLYLELPHGTIAKEVKLEDIHKAARRIFHPYTLEFAETSWWSAYSIGQRLVDHFSKDNRIFLTGDACHTHSPKAGQGMNTSLQDGYNIGWKLAMVLQNRSHPDLLKTYNTEREKVAADLIDFDRWFMSLFSSRSKGDKSITPEQFSEGFIRSGRYTAGFTATYEASPITSPGPDDGSLVKNVTIGMRLPSTQVVRFCDARALQLVRAFPADGRWRLLIFAGDISDPGAASRLKKLAEYLDSPKGPVRTFTPADDDIDSFIEPVLLLSGKRTEIEQEQVPEFFWPVTGKWLMRDLHKTFIDDSSYNSGHGHAYDFYGVDPKGEGAIVIVRPDQYLSKIVPLNAFEPLFDFFSGFCLPRKMVNGS